MVIRTEAVIVTCIDYRLQQLLDTWIQNHLGYGNYNRVALAGGVKNWDVIASQIELSKRVHDITTVILVNHEDCRAYGEDESIQRHADDLRKARAWLNVHYPDLSVELYYAHLNGVFEPIR